MATQEAVIVEIEQLTLAIFENKEYYKDNDFIVILNILRESYMKAKGILGELNEYNEKVPIELCEACEESPVFADDLCSYCYYDCPTEDDGDDPTYTGTYLSAY